jgi:hypothetical protein
MSTTIQKKQFKKINARTVDDLINNIRNTNISQSEIIDKLNMDNDFSKVLKQTPNDEVNILAENLINKNYFKALRTLQEEHPNIKIFNLMDDIKTQEYIRFLYIIPKEEVLYSDVDTMINQGALFALTYAYNNNVLEVEKDIVEYSKEQYNNDKTETKLTIYNLFNQIYKDKELIKESESNREKICNNNEIIPAIVYKSTSVVLPYLQVLPKDFILDLLFEETYPVRQNSFIQFDQSSYLGGLPSIYSKDNFEDFILDRKWIMDSNNYIINLSREDKFTVYGYTHNGDVIVNMLLRNNEKEIRKYILDPYRIIDNKYQPLFFQLRKTLLAKDYGISKGILNKMTSNDLFESYNAICKNQKNKESIPEEAYLTAAKMFLEDLKRIINDSPPITQSTIVYRGSKTLYYSTTNKKTFKNNSFMSTSYGVWGPTNFTNRILKCCIKKITLKAGTKALFIDCITQYDSESEILLPPDNEFKILSHEINTYYDMPTIDQVSEDTVMENFCLGRKNYMTVTTMEQI